MNRENQTMVFGFKGVLIAIMVFPQDEEPNVSQT